VNEEQQRLFDERQARTEAVREDMRRLNVLRHVEPEREKPLGGGRWTYRGEVHTCCGPACQGCPGCDDHPAIAEPRRVKMKLVELRPGLAVFAEEREADRIKAAQAATLALAMAETEVERGARRLNWLAQAYHTQQRRAFARRTRLKLALRGFVINHLCW
jgi:hypothetical protein